MIYFFTPYSFDKRLLESIDSLFEKVGPRDWVVLLDGDTLFLRSDFGHKIRQYIQNYPDTGLFTCYASRCHYQCQVPKIGDPANDSILFHKSIADRLDLAHHLKVKELDRRIAGHLMAMKKTTWITIRQEVFKTAANKMILGVDTKISNAIRGAGMKIRLMRGIYILHYLRLKEGFGHKNHLL